MNKKNLVIFLPFLVGFLCQHKTITVASDIKVSKLNKMINWSDAENYVEAKQTLAIAKRISREKRRRKELRDARVPEDEIRRIIQNERIAYTNGAITDKNNKSNIQTENQTEDQDMDNKNSHDYSNMNNNIESNSESLITNSSIDEKQPKTASDRVISESYHDRSSNNKVALSSEKDEDTVIDLSIVPNAPTITIQNAAIDSITNNNYDDDFELSRMLQKAGENLNNSQNFAIFAKKIAKIANRPLKEQDMIKTPEMMYVQDNNLYPANQMRQTISSKDFDSSNKQKYPSYKSNTRYKNVYNAKLHNIYAVAEHAMQNENNNNIVNSAKNNIDFYINGNKKKENSNNLLAMMSDDSIMISEKQMRAKNIGAPYPTKRNNKDHLNQYLPQNISQITYDKNNRHLEPAVFEKDVINQVISSIGTKSDNVQTVRALMDKLGKIDIADDDGNTILMHAVARGNQPLISMLLSEGASPNAFNKDGFTPMHLAASNGDNLSAFSLTISGGDPNLTDKNGNTPLMYAAKMCNSDTIKVMMSLGGDPIFVNKFTGRTAVDFAKESGNDAIISLLTTENKKKYGKRKPVNLNIKTL